MKRFLIAFGILLIAGGIGVLEYVMFPERTLSLPGVENTAEENNTNPENFAPVSQLSGKNFEVAGLADIQRKNSGPTYHLFNQITVNVEEDNLLVLKSDFEDLNQNTILISIYEVFPAQDTTASRAFTYLKEKFEQQFSYTVESGVNQTDDLGLHSFYVNVEALPEKTFLVVVTSERLLAFEYLKRNHQILLPVLQQFAPAQNASAES